MFYVVVAETYPANADDMVAPIYGKGATQLEAMLDTVREFNTDRFNAAEAGEYDPEEMQHPVTEQGFYDWTEHFGSESTIAIVNTGPRADDPTSDKVATCKVLLDDLEMHLRTLRSSGELTEANEQLNIDRAIKRVADAVAPLDSLLRNLRNRAS
jgi:hypothetical protein